MMRKLSSIALLACVAASAAAQRQVPAAVQRYFSLVRPIFSGQNAYDQTAFMDQYFRWPGNIRQLENRIKKAVVLADSAYITPEDLDVKPEQLEPILPLAVAQEQWKERYIDEALDRNGQNRTKTAKDLDVDPRTIFRHLRAKAEKSVEALPEDLPEGEP